MNFEKAINILIERITKENTPDEALKYTQAILNLAHADATEVATNLQRPTK